MTLNKTEVLKKSDELFDFSVENRRHLHQHPELSFQEHETTTYISKKLLEIPGVKIISSLPTGVVGYLFEPRFEETILLRADIDALPIIEKNTFDFVSKNKGIMHACGHDFHTASLISSLHILHEFKEHLKKNVAFVFQLAEEKLPGGAKQLIEAGIIDQIKPKYVIGQHVDPTIDCGIVGMKPGAYMASNDEVYITVKTQGGHGALPHSTPDSVFIASSIIVGLQQVVSRVIPPTIPSVLSFGKIIGEGATNILPAEVKIEGTFRIFSEQWRHVAKEKIRTIAQNIAQTSGAECDVNIIQGYPVLVNDTNMVSSAITSLQALRGTDSVWNLDYRMTSEDFAYFSQKYKSLFYRIGVKHDHQENYGLHHEKFNLNEEALKVSPAIMAWIALNLKN